MKIIKEHKAAIIRKDWGRLEDCLEVVVGQRYYINLICYDGKYYEVTVYKLKETVLTDQISEAIEQTTEADIVRRVMCDDRASALRMISYRIRDYYPK